MGYRALHTFSWLRGKAWTPWALASAGSNQLQALARERALVKMGCALLISLRLQFSPVRDGSPLRPDLRVRVSSCPLLRSRDLNGRYDLQNRIKERRTLLKILLMKNVSSCTVSFFKNDEPCIWKEVVTLVSYFLKPTFVSQKNPVQQGLWDNSNLGGQPLPAPPWLWIHVIPTK